MSAATIGAIERAQWEVIWLAVKKTKKGKIHKEWIITETGTNLPAALRIYNLAAKAKKPMLTLRCKNVGHPPPPQIEQKIKAYNNAGYHWCPYCMNLRKFELRQGYYTDEGSWINKRAYYCPVCDVSSTDWHVRKYNPILANLAYRKKTRSRGKKK